MTDLDRKIEEILKQHPCGEDFFNHLDSMIRENRDIIDLSYNLLIDYINNNLEYFWREGLILTGAFGQVVINTCDNLVDDFGEVIIAPGGLRQEGVKANLLIDYVESDEFILFDDSFYSGTTRDKLEAALQEYNSNAKIIHTVCIYDGGHDNNVTSLYKYYK